MSKRKLSSNIYGQRVSALFFGLLPIVVIFSVGLLFGFYMGTIVILLLTIVLIAIYLNYNYFYFDLFLEDGDLILEKPFPYRKRVHLTGKFKILPIELLSYGSFFYVEDKGKKYRIKLNGDSLRDRVYVEELAKQKEIEFRNLLA